MLYEVITGLVVVARRARKRGQLTPRFGQKLFEGFHIPDLEDMGELLKRFAETRQRTP